MAGTEVVIELSTLIGGGATLVGTLGGAVLAGVKLFFAQFERRLDARFRGLELGIDAMNRAIGRESERIDELEQAFADLRAELPEKYQRREDWIRSQSIVDAKLDAIAGQIAAMNKRSTPQ